MFTTIICKCEELHAFEVRGIFRVPTDLRNTITKLSSFCD